MSKDETLFSETEVANRLRVSRITVMRARKRNQIGYYRIGSRVVYSAQHVDAFLEARERGAK